MAIYNALLEASEDPQADNENVNKHVEGWVQPSMDSEDDICVLPRASESEEEVDTAALPIIPLSLLSPTTSFDLGSHHALQKAFTQLKRHLDETNFENQKLIKKIIALETESFVSSPGGTGSGQCRMEGTAVRGEEEVGLQQAAEEGFSKNLQRQLTRARSQLQAVETKYQEKVQESDRKLSVMKQQLQEALVQVEMLRKEKRTLQQIFEEEKREKEAAMQTVKDLREKCDCLELEKEKNIKEEAALHYSLRKAQQELVILKEKQGEITQPEASSELAEEVAYMRKVIRNLRDMVLAQRRHLGSCGKLLSMSSSPRFLQSTQGRSLHREEPETSSPLGGSHSTSSPSGQSWEMVNVTHSPSLSTRQQQEQQQLQQLMAMKQRCVTSSSSEVSPCWDHQNMVTNTAVMGEPIVNGGVDSGRATVTSSGTTPKFWGSQSVVIQRPQNHRVANLSKSRSEVVRSSSCHASRSQDYTDGSSPQQHCVGEEEIFQPYTPRFAPSQSTPAGSKHFPPDPQATTESWKEATVLPTSPLQLQIPLLKDPSDIDNIDAYTHGSTAPSMHILNPGVMAGARVIRNNEDSFGSSGETWVMGSHLLPGLSTAVSRERNVAGGVPSEQVQAVDMNRAAMPELSPFSETNFIQAPVINQVKSGLDHKCPVCGQDFSHVSMDEFQTHVFQCFDNAEESASAPETLQPESAVKPGAESTNRICPMCEKKFAEVSQQFFEGHVQSHFEEVAEQFEVLDVKEP